MRGLVIALALAAAGAVAIASSTSPRGTVPVRVESDGGGPISGALIVWGGETRTTDRRGEARFDRRRASLGVALLTVRAVGYTGGQVLLEGQPVDLTLVLVPVRPPVPAGVVRVH